MSDAVTVSSLSKSFDPAGFAGVFRRIAPWMSTPAVAALESISIRVDRGEIYGIVGSNGSGKSTLARIVATLLIPDAGSVEVFGHDVREDTLAVRRLINRVSVEASFWKKLSPLENLMFSARLYGVPRDRARADVFRILARLGVPEASVTRPMDQMSRGMQQKTAVARALLTSPALLILDEPTTGLDPRSKRDVQAFIREVRETHDATVLLLTHDMDEAQRLSDRMAILDEGRVLVEGTPAQLRRGGETLEDAFIRHTGHGTRDGTTTPAITAERTVE